MPSELTPERLTAIRARCEAATPGPWGRYGGPAADGVVPPMQGAMEAAPGLSIGSVDHTEPIARFSGYLLPVEANVEFVANARTDLPDILAALDASEAEVARLRERVSFGNHKRHQCEDNLSAAEARIKALEALLGEYEQQCDNADCSLCLRARAVLRSLRGTGDS